MKRIVKKNQFILTLLAVMIAVAGYLSYAGKFQMSGKKQAAATAAETGEGTLAAGLLEISDEELLAENQAGKDISVAEEGQEEALAQETGAADESGADTAGADMPGEAVLTGGSAVTNYVSQAQLSREQVRSKNKETLLEVINNTTLSEEQKNEAVSQMIALTETAEKENAAETLLGAKGFTGSVVCINGSTVDVVVGKTELTDAQRAQIEDIVKRKTEAAAADVVITLMDPDQ